MCDNLDSNRVRCDVCRTINLAKQVKHPKPDMQIYEKCSPVGKIECARVTGASTLSIHLEAQYLLKFTTTNNSCYRFVVTKTISYFQHLKKGWLVLYKHFYQALNTSHAGNIERITKKCDKYLIKYENVGRYFLFKVPLNPTCIKVCTKEEFKLGRGSKVSTPRLPYYAHGKILYAVKAGILVGTVYFTYTQGVWGDQQDVTECIKRWQEYIKSINTRRPPTFDHCGNVIRKESTESIIAPIYNLYKNVVTTCFSGIVKFPVIIKCAYMDYLSALQKKHEEDERERKIRKRG